MGSIAATIAGAVMMLANMAQWAAIFGHLRPFVLVNKIVLQGTPGHDALTAAAKNKSMIPTMRRGTWQRKKRTRDL